MDYKELYAELTQKMEKELPITAYPIRELVQIFREQNNPITLKSKLTITSVFNSGDISGIICTVKESDTNVLACSLTHLLFEKNFKLYHDILQYQEKRCKRIQLLNRL
jgi:hypothetical protein